MAWDGSAGMLFHMKIICSIPDFKRCTLFPYGHTIRKTLECRYLREWKDV